MKTDHSVKEFIAFLKKFASFGNYGSDGKEVSVCLCGQHGGKEKTSLVNEYFKTDIEFSIENSGKVHDLLLQEASRISGIKIVTFFWRSNGYWEFWDQETADYEWGKGLHDKRQRGFLISGKRWCV